MQYNPVFNGSNNNTQNMGEFPKGSPAVGEAGRPPINNIFARNTITSQNGGNPPTPQNFLISPNTNNQNASKPPPFTFSPNLPQTSGLLASGNMNVGIKNNISNPFTSANSTAFNNFGGGSAQTNVFANNSLQNGNKNTAIFNNNSNSNTVNTSFINTNQKSFAPTFTNSLTKINFNNPNAQSSLSPMFPNSQTLNNSNQNNNTSFINNNLTNPPNPFLNPVSNNTTITTGSNLNPFATPNNLMNNLHTQSNNSYNSVENTQNTQSFQSKSQINSNMQPNSNTHIQEMIEKMNINDLKTWDSPYNFFHTQLILNNIFQNNKKQEEQSYLLKKQQQIKVKDSPYKHYIIFMIAELIKAVDNIQEMQQRATQLNLTAEQLEQSLKNRLNDAAKINFIKMLKFERMVKDIQTELNFIESELFNFLRPLLQAYQTKSYIPFEEPDDFNIEIANNIMVKIELIQKNITKIAQQSISIYDFIDSLNQRNIAQAKRTISQLIIYFEDVCIQFETLKQRYESFQIVYNKEKKENYVKKIDRQVEDYEISDKIIIILAKSQKKIQVGLCKSQKKCK